MTTSKQNGKTMEEESVIAPPDMSTESDRFLASLKRASQNAIWINTQDVNSNVLVEILKYHKIPHNVLRPVDAIALSKLKENQ